MNTPSLQRVPLAFPSLLSLGPAASEADAPRSWIQLARTGSFVSNRYGKFEITRDDLSQMLSNFRNVTPKAPTELPIDYDHLSMDPKQPGDGVAAGWLKAVELRADGEELWGEVEWTPQAAGLIKNRAYRFVSPSFVKDHVGKDGKKIGTTLIAAAITNHPFLESMAALTLYSFSALGDLAMAVPPNQPGTATAYHLSELGQRVSFAPDAERTPELTDEERGQTFLVKSTVGDGDDQFVRLTRQDGTEFGWFRATQLEPATAPQKEENSPLPNQQPEPTENNMQTTKELEKKAASFAQRVTDLSKGRTMREAFDLAQDADAEGAEAYRLVGVGAEIDPEATPSPVLSLSARPDETFDELVMRFADEKHVPLRDAAHAVAVARPDLVAAR
jgi:hypothetical protein